MVEEYKLDVKENHYSGNSLLFNKDKIMDDGSNKKNKENDEGEIMRGGSNKDITKFLNTENIDISDLENMEKIKERFCNV